MAKTEKDRVKPRGQGFFVEPMHKGQRHRHTFPTDMEARQWLLRFDDAVAKGLPIPDPVVTVTSSKLKTLKEIAHRTFEIRWSSQDTGDKTLRDAMVFVRWAGPDTLAAAAFTSANIQDYVAHMKREHKSGATINRHLRKIGPMADVALGLGLITAMPKLPLQKESEHRLRFFTYDEEDEIQRKLGTWGLPQWQDYFLFLCETGVRPSEAQKLRWQNVANGVIRIEQTKTHVKRSLGVSQMIADVLERCKARDPKGAGPFSWVKERHARTLWDRLRENIHWMDEETIMYTYRHTCASRMTIDNEELQRIMRWMGHKAIATTLRYAHLRVEDVMEVSTRIAAARERNTRSELRLAA